MTLADVVDLELALNSKFCSLCSGFTSVVNNGGVEFTDAFSILNHESIMFLVSS